MSKLKHSVFFKVSTITLIILLLLIPTSMIRSLIGERENLQNEAISEVSSKWAGSQTLTGPFLSIPYDKYVKEYSEKNKTVQVIKTKEFIQILPYQLKINGYINPEKRYRGIYEVVVYNSKVNLSGIISLTELSSLDIPLSDIHLDKAELVLGISDLRGLEQQVSLKWDSSNINFNPGSTSGYITQIAIHGGVGLNSLDSTGHTFEMALDLKGSQNLYFTPVGKITDIELNSNWNNPSFNGAFLPDEREISEQGFHAHWNVLHLNRSFPQIWSGDGHRLSESHFGVDLLLPVDNYQKSYRSIRYAILFILFTFLVFFFIEVLNKVFIHPIQYLLVGVALIVFYTLLLSLSEHFLYNFAFLISALATMLLIGGYVKAILKSNVLAGLITGILSILYLFIFVIIQLQDYALLIGSIGLFLILSLVMYYSRKIDWYNLNLGQKDKLPEPIVETRDSSEEQQGNDSV